MYKMCTAPTHNKKLHKLGFELLTHTPNACSPSFVMLSDIKEWSLEICRDWSENQLFYRKPIHKLENIYNGCILTYEQS